MKKVRIFDVKGHMQLRSGKSLTQVKMTTVANEMNSTVTVSEAVSSTPNTSEVTIIPPLNTTSLAQSSTQTSLIFTPSPPIMAVGNVTSDGGKKEVEVVEFNPESGMKFEAWLAYFDGYCVETRKDDIWKARNIPKYLKGRALTVFINNCMNMLHWEEIIEILHEEFTSPEQVTLGDFSSIKFNRGDNVSEYYQKKLQIGRLLGLETRFLMEGLTEGLPSELKSLVIVNSPKSLGEWREVVTQLNKIQRNERVEEASVPVRPNYSPNQTRNWVPPRNNQGFYNQTQVRPWNYRFPYSNQPRHFVPSNARPQRVWNNPPTGYTPPQNPRSVRPNMHFQDRLPPAPCKFCTNLGIQNAYHWHQSCPFRDNDANSRSPRTRTVPQSARENLRESSDTNDRSNY